MSIKCIFFDLDGTLWDASGCNTYAMKRAVLKMEKLCESRHLTESYTDCLNIAMIDSIIDNGLRTLYQNSYTLRFAKMLQRCGIDDTDIAMEVSSHCLAAYRLAVRTFLRDDAHDTLVRLGNKGITTGIITNGTPGVKRNIINSLGLQNIINHIVMGEAEGYVKPDVRIFQRCMQLAGTNPPETLFVGDTFFTDVLGAKRAGAAAALLCAGKVRIPCQMPAPDYAFKNLKAVLSFI